MNRTTKYFFCIALFFIPFALCIMHPLFNYYNSDIGRYLASTMATLSHHSWIWPKTIYGNPYLEKGPVLYWFYQVLWPLIHNKALIFSITHFIFYIGVGLSTVYLAKTIHPHKFNLVSASYVFLVTLFSTIMLSLLFVYKFDKLLTIFIILNWALCIDTLKTGSFSRAFILIITMLFGPLIKGPVFTLYTLPLLLFIPFVLGGDKKRYYCNILPALILGTAMPLLYIFTSRIDQTYVVSHQVSNRIGLFPNFLSHFTYIWRFFTDLSPWILAPSILLATSNYLKNDQNKTSLKIFFLATTLAFIVMFCFIAKVNIRYIIPIYIFILMITGIAVYKANYKYIIKYDQYYCLIISIIVMAALIFMLSFDPIRHNLFHYNNYLLFCFGYGLIALMLLLSIVFFRKKLNYYYFLAAMAICSIFSSFLFSAFPFSLNEFSKFDHMSQTIKQYISIHPNTTIAVYDSVHAHRKVQQWAFYQIEPKHYFLNTLDQKTFDIQLQKNSNVLLISYIGKPPFKNIHCFHHETMNFKRLIKLGHPLKKYPINFYMCTPTHA